MPRQPRLDAFRSSSGTFAGTLHHVMVRGIERRPLEPVLGGSPNRSSPLSRAAPSNGPSGTVSFARAKCDEGANVRLRCGRSWRRENEIERGRACSLTIQAGR
jgi:hypothetical protein